MAWKKISRSNGADGAAQGGSNPRMWQCKLCGHIQDIGDNICRGAGCGADLTSYGEVIQSGSPPPPPPPPPRPRPLKWIGIGLLGIVAVFVVLIVFGLVFSMCDSDPGPTPTPTPTQSAPPPETTPPIEVPGTTEVAVAPDFQDFAGEYATAISVHDVPPDGSYLLTFFLDPPNGADHVVGEYLALLRDSYSYQLQGSTVVQHEDEDYTYDCSWFSYTGQADVDTFSYHGTSIPVNIEDAALFTFSIERESTGSRWLYIYISEDITLESAGVHTSYEGPAVAPDFLAFAGGYATEASLDSDPPRGSYRQAFRIAPPSAAGSIVDEYLALLRDSYSYQLQGSTVYQYESNGYTYTCSLNWYSYTGQADVGTFSWNANSGSVSVKETALLTYYMERAGGGGKWLRLYFSEDIKLETADAHASYVDNAAPDFLAFADGRAEEDSQNNEDNYYARKYVLTQDGSKRVLEEYLALLESDYPYTLAGTGDLGESYTYYWFTYTGPEKINTFGLTVNLKVNGEVRDTITMSDTHLIVGVQKDGEEITKVEVCPANGLELRDDGYRTS